MNRTSVIRKGHSASGGRVATGAEDSGPGSEEVCGGQDEER